MWPQCATLLPHALVASDQAEQQHVQPAGTSRLLDRAASYLHGRGRYGEAQALAQRALALDEHPTTAQSREWLAAVLAALENRQ